MPSHPYHHFLLIAWIIAVPVALCGIFAPYRPAVTPPWMIIQIRTTFLLLLLCGLSGAGQYVLTQSGLVFRLHQIHQLASGAVLGLFALMCFTQGERRKYKMPMPEKMAAPADEKDH